MCIKPREKLKGGYKVVLYAKIWDYYDEINRNNPGSTVVVKTNLQGVNLVFKRIYICFAALKRGFAKRCRSIVGFDGCHIKRSHPE